MDTPTALVHACTTGVMHTAVDREYEDTYNHTYSVYCTSGTLYVCRVSILPCLIACNASMSWWIPSSATADMITGIMIAVSLADTQQGIHVGDH